MDALRNEFLSEPVAIPLGAKILGRLVPEIATPRYMRDELTPGMVHIGVGNFHRAHLAWYLHRLMQLGRSRDWAIIGSGVRPTDAVVRRKLLAQDCLTTLIELRPDGVSAEICGSMIDFLAVEEENGPLIERMADPATRIVSLTVTEGGYYINAANGLFHSDHPEVTYDVAHPERPRTVFGAIVASLARRREDGTGPFTVMSCDNLCGNGDVTRSTIVSMAGLRDPELADWIDTNCCFPNSMVDCIVPATGPEEIALARSLGIIDAAPVTHENYRQWVIEDRFCAGRPDWERVGVTFTDDVRTYELMKIRILNAGHQVLANAGELLSIDTIAECVAHPRISALFDRVQREEIMPFVGAVPGVAPAAYVNLIRRRFANPAIHDTTRRVAFDGSSRHAGFVLPIVRDALDAGGSVDGLGLVEALWARMCRGVREDGSTIPPNDPFWDDLRAAAEAARERPRTWLEQRSIYGELVDEPRFSEAFERWFRVISSQGTAAALDRYAA